MEVNPVAEEKPVTSNFIRFELNVAAITGLAAEHLNPGKLIPFVQENKSGIVVAALWLALYLRSWFYLFIPIPSLTTLPLVLLTFFSLSFTTPARSLTGLVYHAYMEISSSIASLYKKVLPAWLPHTILVLLLFPITRALLLLFLLAVWEIIATYRNGIASITEQTGQAIQGAVSAAEKADEHVRYAKGLEMQAMQLAAYEESSTAVVDAAKHVKKEVEDLVNKTAALQPIVGKVRQLAERAKALAEEGDLELARKIVVNVRKLAARVVQEENEVKTKVEWLRERLWGMGLNQNTA